MRDELEHELTGSTDHVQDQLDGLLDELARVEAWRALDLPPDLDERLAGDRAALLEWLARLLLAWRTTGGDLVLTRAEDEVTEAEPEPEPEPEPLPEPEPEEDLDEEDTEDTPLPEEPPPLPIRRAPPASPAALKALVERIETGEAQIEDTGPAPDWPRLLAEMTGGLALDPEDDERELQLLLRLVDTRRDWVKLPQAVQQLLVAVGAARGRRLQDDRGCRDWELSRCFSRLTAYSSQHRPGFVVGLNQQHSPRGESWEDDAERYWDELLDTAPPTPEQSATREELLRDVARIAKELPQAPPAARSAVQSQLRRKVKAALDGGVRPADPGLLRLVAAYEEALEGTAFKRLRKAIRDLDEDETEQVRAGPTLPPDWAWRGWTQGKTALVVGGVPREERRQALEAEFGFASLVWEDAFRRTQVLQTLAQRVRSGSYDLVIFLRTLIGHSADNIVLQACKDSGVAWAHVERGYGATQIQQAIERYLPEG